MTATDSVAAPASSPPPLQVRCSSHFIAWLATPEAEFVTGGIVDVNGASYLRS